MWRELGMLKQGIPLTLIYIISAMLFLSIASMPYGYYTLLRIVVCTTFIFASIISYYRNYKNLTLLYALISIIFNPIIKIHFDKEVWIFIDVIASIILIVTANKITKKDAN
jgi:hypothetical protein